MISTETSKPGIVIDGKFLPWDPEGKRCPSCGGPIPEKEKTASCGNCKGEEVADDYGTITPLRADIRKGLFAKRQKH